MRAVALDVHRDFCEVAVVEQGELRSAGRIETTPEALELFAQSVGPHDYVALEVTGNAWEIARIIEPHVARVIPETTNPGVPGVALAGVFRWITRSYPTLARSPRCDEGKATERRGWIERDPERDPERAVRGGF